MLYYECVSKNRTRRNLRFLDNSLIFSKQFFMITPLLTSFACITMTYFVKFSRHVCENDAGTQSTILSPSVNAAHLLKNTQRNCIFSKNEWAFLHKIVVTKRIFFC